MTVLFCAQHFSYFRNFESVIRALSARGHTVRLMADERESIGGQELVDRLAAECPGVSYGFAPSLEDEPWFNLATKLRLGLEYVRFLDRRYDGTPKYRYRADVRTPRLLLWFFRIPGARSWPLLRAMAGLLVRAEHLLPPSGALEAFLRREAPDVVLLASVTNPGSQEMDCLKAARRLRMPVGLTIFSWDHLSGKSWVRVPADRVFVWNEVQKREAVEEHFMPAGSVEVTGAQCWDQWFDCAPRRTREAFCREVGLNPDRPFVLYACSVLSRPAPNEARFVRDWIERLRASADPRLLDVGVLVRPHPERADEWRDVTLEGLANVAFRGRNPVDPAAKDDYLDSMYHCAAMVGIVTSAFIEAAAVGREVLTLELPEFSLHQQGAPHYHYLVEVAGGLLHVGRSFDEHFAQLAACVSAAGGARSARNRRFLESFVRPRGLSSPATPIFVESIERFAREGAVAEGPVAYPAWQYTLLRRLAAAGNRGIGAWLLMDERDAQYAAAMADKARIRREALAAKNERLQAELRQRDRRVREKEDVRRRKDRRRTLREGRRQIVRLGRRLLGRDGAASQS